ncbi:hypothetical protein LNKW23_33150 [Paralimibaculum aggregatum]|uniref:DUF2125 domain-containing protein n=1 Tax=Paralimibaculum aggregatum TaxID=3036245 RepID=A0ABQ6LNT0_9RHOB|nr:DUF2125 domain-containing protein [Limibaculum sp. NKW23]GMG84101.1 hypothetical protein LNKW23_33150 [Limibaculum sp. NKW23]
MRRMARLFSSLATLTAILWCALWFWGRDAISTQIEGEIDRLRAGGLGISVGERSIAGFPFAYAARFENLTFTDRATGLRTELPEITSMVAIADPGTLVTELPAEMTVTVAVPPGLRDRYPGLGAELALAITSEGLAVETDLAGDGAGGPGARSSIRAVRLEIAPAVALEGLDFALRIEGLAGSLGRAAADGGDGPGAAELTARHMALHMVETPPGAAAETLTADLALADVTLKGAARRADPAALGALFAGLRPGEAALELVAGAVTGALEMASPPVAAAGARAADGRITLDAGRFAGRLTVQGPDISTELETEALSLALAPAMADDPRRGEIRASRLRIASDAPQQAGTGPRPVRVLVEAEGLEPAPALWNRIDPEAVLPREPGRIAVEIDGTGRLLRPHETVRPGEATPLEIGNLSVRRFDVAALGAHAAAEGDIEFLQPIYEPRGAVTLRLSGALGLIRRLHGAGLLDESEVQWLATMAALYTRGGAGPDELVTEMVFDAEGTRINDSRID